MATPYQARVTQSAREREAIVLQWRADHIPLREIGERLGITAQRVSQIHRKACERIPAEALHEIRTRSAELADRAIHDLLSIARNPNVSPRTRVEAYSCIEKWDSSQRVLFGANAPQRREISVITADEVDKAIMALSSEIAAKEAQMRAAGLKVDFKLD